MSRRATAVLAVVLYGLLGLVVGLGDYRGLIGVPLAREREFSLRPNGILWIEGLETSARLLDAWALPLRALAVALLLVAFWFLATLLTKGFRLTKPADQQPGRGVTTHLDVPQLLRAGLGALLSLWVLGGLGFLASLASSRGRPSPIPSMVLGGLPVWTSPFPFVSGMVVHSMLAALLVWWVWGPRGLVAQGTAVPRRDQLVCALLAGVALTPAILALHDGRTWLVQASQAYSLADRSGWSQLTGLAVALPALAAAYCAAIAALYRPRTLSQPSLIGLICLSATIAVATGGMVGRINRETGRLDLQYSSLAARLNLRTSPLGRFAFIFTPDGGVYSSSVPDGSANEDGEDRIACDGKSIDAAKAFLQERNYRTALAPRAYQHLVSCYSLDWLATRSMTASLAMLEHAPTSAALTLLQEKLANCATTPENRAFFLALADPKRFTYRDEAARRWLGFAALRFGEMDRAREYLLNSGLSKEEVRQLFGGISPLTEGLVQGKMTLNGRPRNGVRLGLLRLDYISAMVGLKQALDWRQVLELAHTNPKGEFRFRSIPEGRYVLVVTGAGIVPGRRMPQMSPVPSLINLSRRQPRYQMPTFDLHFVLPPPRSRPERRPDMLPERTPLSTISWRNPGERRSGIESKTSRRDRPRRPPLART